MTCRRNLRSAECGFLAVIWHTALCSCRSQNLCRLGLLVESLRGQKGKNYYAYKVITGKEKKKIENFFEFSATGYKLRVHSIGLQVARRHFSVIVSRVIGIGCQVTSSKHPLLTRSRTVMTRWRVGHYKADASIIYARYLGLQVLYKYKYKFKWNIIIIFTWGFFITRFINVAYSSLL